MKKNNSSARATYTEAQRIATVAILLANSKGGGGMSNHAIHLAREYLQSNVSTDTLSKWIHKYRDKVQQAIAEPQQDVVTAEIVYSAQNNAVETMEHIRDSLLAMIERMMRENPHEIEKQGMQRLVTSVAILQDKIKDAIAASATMQAAIRPLALWCSENGLNIYDVLQDVYTAYSRLSAEQIEAYKNRGMLSSGS